MTLRDNIFRRLLDQEKEKQDELSRQFDDVNSAEMNKIAWCRSMLDEICNQEELLNRTSRVNELHNKTGVALLQTLTEFKQETDKCQSAIANYKPSDMSKLLLENTEKLDEFMKTEVCDIIEIKQSSATGNGHRVRTDDPPNAALIQKSKNQPKGHVDFEKPLNYGTEITWFRTTVSAEEKVGYAVGIAWVDDQLVIADRWNQKLKLFCIDGTYLECMLFTDGDPWDVTVMKESATEESALAATMRERYCLVTVPSRRVILNVTVPKSGRMKIRTCISTEVEPYACIAHGDTKALHTLIVCGVCAPFGAPRIDLIKMTGQLIRSFALDHMQKPIFSCPRSVDISEDGMISVSDWKRNMVIFLHVDGRIIGGHDWMDSANLQEPAGTSLDGRGNVFVADKKAGVIHVFKVGGKRIGALKTDTALQEPRELNVQVGPHPRLAVTYGSGFVKLYDLFERDTTENVTSV